MHHEPRLIDVYAAAIQAQVKPGTIRQWLRRGKLTHHGYDLDGRALVDLDELAPQPAAQAA
ncbi:hypothetical protein [Streptomyces antimycoticus]|uniref:hypothetical protein n=1 Tax=Streptomyces antimycoticus TaxID=68175 RepID=UPI003865B691|nr:hypothetical protein OG751_23160 [Streptomyces antimycoticus]